MDQPSPEQIAAMQRITTIGDPILRSAASPVSEFGPQLSELVGEMLQVAAQAGGVGLAAPQIGVPRRLIVLFHSDGSVQALANPSIVERSEEETVAVERCLSIPGVAVEVSRPVAVTVAAQDLQGHPDRLDVEGWEARIIQHEIDHLDGKLILDRCPRSQRKAALRALRNGESYAPPGAER